MASVYLALRPTHGDVSFIPMDQVSAMAANDVKMVLTEMALMNFSQVMKNTQIFLMVVLIT